MVPFTSVRSADTLPTTAKKPCHARALPLTDACGFPLRATPLTVKAEDYPLTAPLFLATARHRQPLLIREFLEYLATDSAQAAVAAAGYVDRRLGMAPLTEDGERLLGAIRNAGTEVPLADLQRLAHPLCLKWWRSSPWSSNAACWFDRLIV